MMFQPFGAGDNAQTTEPHGLRQRHGLFTHLAYEIAMLTITFDSNKIFRCDHLTG